MLAYSRCVRSHGVPGFPDPDSSGNISKNVLRQLGVSDSVLKAATYACRNLNPYQNATNKGGAGRSPQLTDYLKFARCMRTHGVPGFPDPTTGAKGQPEFVISISRDGFDPHSSQILDKARECLQVLPAGAGLPAATVTP